MRITQSPYLSTFKEPRYRFWGIDSSSLCILAGQYDNSAGILEQSMVARNRVGIGFTYRTVKAYACGIDSLESIPGLLKSVKIPSLGCQTSPLGWESIPRLLKRLTNTGSGCRLRERIATSEPGEVQHSEVISTKTNCCIPPLWLSCCRLGRIFPFQAFLWIGAETIHSEVRLKS